MVLPSPMLLAAARPGRLIPEGNTTQTRLFMTSQTISAELTSAGTIASRLFRTRSLSLELASPLSAEDMTVQAMDDASPTKWHLAHVTWFFETFILSKHLPGYRTFDETFNYCFNSYYESQGARQPRPKRGLLTRPTSERVLAYRAHVDDGLAKLLARGVAATSPIARLVEVGINHEQQHQELLLTDILALFAANPLRPAYCQPSSPIRPAAPEPMQFIEFAGGLGKIGHDGQGFAWDNELPRHDALIHPFQLADRLVTNAEWLQFMADGGYRTASLWLADGWGLSNREGWQAPLYWQEQDGEWLAMSLHGLKPVDPAAPVTHVSYYEADAFARWAGQRPPNEAEWEIAAEGTPVAATTLATRALRPLPAEGTAPDSKTRETFGDGWERSQ